MIPFAVVGSEKTIVVGGKQVRGRQNRWGVVNGEISIISSSVTYYTKQFHSRGRDPLRICLPPQLPHPYPPPRSY